MDQVSFLQHLQAAIQEAADRGEGTSRAERVVMRISVLTCAALLVAGIARFALEGGQVASLRLNRVLDVVLSGDAGAWIPLGLLVLCLSPLLRAMTLATLYARRRGWDLVLTTVVVTLAIVMSFLIGLR